MRRAVRICQWKIDNESDGDVVWESYSAQLQQMYVDMQLKRGCSPTESLLPLDCASRLVSLSVSWYVCACVKKPRVFHKKCMGKLYRMLSFTAMGL